MWSFLEIYPTVRSPYFPSQGGDAPTIIAENHDKSSPSSTTILPLIPLTMLNLLRNKQQVSPAPYIFFHSPSGHWWEEGTDPILLNCRSINEEAVQHLLSSLSVNVSKPDALLAWLETNDASYITALHVHL